jgi:delta 1-pyrroline-5-carboxylate dehydrogenase
LGRSRDVSEVAVVIVVYTLAHAVGALRAAARAARPVMLLSAHDAGIYAGPGWFGALVEAAREAVPDARLAALLDCGDRPGAALAAIRGHIEGVIFTGRADVARRLANIARQHGVRLVNERPAAGLDLGDDFFASAADSERRCTEFLACVELRDGAW